MTARKWVIANRFAGFPNDSDLEMQEEPLPELQNGEFLVEAQYLSVDPYMRAYEPRQKIGSTMPGQQLAKVAKSKNPNYPEGKLVLAGVGWRDKTVINLNVVNMDSIVMNSIHPALDTGNLPSSLNLGVLGMPGFSAYFGFLRICQPQPGETVFVNSAAGVVGSTVGQIAKIKGCRVIGCAGSDDKCKWLKDDLGFDFVFNYKTEDLTDALKRGAPNGIDCYFDNVGGDMTTTVLEKFMNRYGRVSVCGVISSYNDSTVPTGHLVYGTILQKELKVQGFIVDTFKAEKAAAAAELWQWIKEGKLKWKEDIVEGFENMRTAFFGLLQGKYTGKVLVKAKI